jgi:hypothetical protein
LKIAFFLHPVSYTGADVQWAEWIGWQLEENGHSVFIQAWDDLNETLEIAELGSMKLHLVDYHLEAGRLCDDEGKHDKAKTHFETAKKMIEETGYHRRDKEIKN